MEKFLIKPTFAMQAFKERLETYARTRHGMGQTRFEDYCGLAHGTISAIKANGPSASVVTRIAVRCPDLNMNWLFRGDGEMLNGIAVPGAKPAVNMENVQAVFITNWTDISDVVEEAVKRTIQNVGR